MFGKGLYLLVDQLLQLKRVTRPSVVKVELSGNCWLLKLEYDLGASARAAKTAQYSGTCSSSMDSSI